MPKDGDMWRIGLNRCGGIHNPQDSMWSPEVGKTSSFHRFKYFGRLFFSKEKVK